jgi:hypothetical protein
LLKGRALSIRVRPFSGDAPADDFRDRKPGFQVSRKSARISHGDSGLSRLYPISRGGWGRPGKARLVPAIHRLTKSRDTSSLAVLLRPIRAVLRTSHIEEPLSPFENSADLLLHRALRKHCRCAPIVIFCSRGFPQTMRVPSAE